MQEQNFKTNKKRKLATTGMAILGVTLVVGGAFAALSDTLSHDETVTIEWVDIVDGSSTNLALEEVNDATNTPVVELTPGLTYELTGTIENDSTVETDWMAINLNTTPGMTVNIADSDGADVPVSVGEDVDVAQFGITVTVDQSITPSTPLNFEIEFTSVDARGYVPTLGEPTALSTVFVDPALATCIANDDELVAITGGDVNYPVSQDELNMITNLTCANLSITSIEGIQYLNNLTTLDLHDNQISDLTPLKYSTNLTHLTIHSNFISDLTPLSNLVNLVFLDLGDNQIVDIAPLAGLTNLTDLRLGYNEISDLTPLSNLTNLTYLNLDDNNISDITPLENLTNLTGLRLALNEITDVTSLAGLSSLTTLNLDYNQITDFSSLTYQPTTFSAKNQSTTLPAVVLGVPTQIAIDGVVGEDFNITFNTPGTYVDGSLTWDNPGPNSLTYTSSDGVITGTITQYVNIEPTAISVLFPDPAMAACIANDDELVTTTGGSVDYVISQEELNSVTNLECTYQGISNIEGIQYMLNLTSVRLDFNAITDISQLANLTNLTELTLGANQISDITALTNLTNLTTLYLGENLIADLTPLTNLYNLTDLDLHENNINNLYPLRNLKNLTHLDLHGNQISYFSSLTYQPEEFDATNQNITLPDVALGTSTALSLDGVNGANFNLTWHTPGTYSNGQLTWSNPGVNSMSYTSVDGLITGTITQTVY